MTTLLAKISKISKVIWLTIGGFLVLWIGYFIYKLQTVTSLGIKLVAAFFLMMGIAMIGIYLLITIMGKLIKFVAKKK